MKKLLNRTWPIILLAFVWLIFAAPYFIQNKTPFPATFQINRFAPWSSYEKFWQPVKNDAMPDIVGQIYPWRIHSVESLKKGQIPLWNPYSFSGTPHLANYQSAALSPFNFLFFVFSNKDAWTILILLQPLLAAFFTFLFAKSLKLGDIGALIASVSFMFCGFMTTWMGYGTLGYAILFLPFALFSIQKFFQTKKIIYLSFISLSVLLSFPSGHFQTSLYFLIFTLAFILFKFFQTKDKKALISTLIFISLGLLISAPQIIPSIELYLNSVRSNIFQKVEAIPLFHFPTIFAPDFFGNPVTRNNPITHYAEWASYTGVLTIFFAIYAAFKIKNKLILFFSAAAIFSLLAAFDTSFLDFLINLKIPVISASSAGRIIVLFSFSIAILSGFGIEKIIEDLKKKQAKFYLIYSLLFVFIFIALFIFSNNFDAKISSVAKRNLIFPFLIFVLGAGSIFLIRLNKKLLPIIMGALLILVTFDMLRFATKWQPFDPKDLIFPDAPIISFFSKISGPHRVIGNFGTGEVSVYYHLPSPEGYDPLYITRYGEFLSTVGSGGITIPARSGVKFEASGLYSKKAIDLLGIKYILFKKQDIGKVWGFPFSYYEDGKFKKVLEDKKYQIYENVSVFPRAYFVKDYTVETTEQKIIDKMFNRNFNLRESAILEKDPKIRAKNANGLAEIKKYEGSTVVIETKSNFPQVLILTDNYYPGWVARIDGVKTEIIRADFTFRAVSVPAGIHSVTFSYEPESFKIGIYLALLGAIGGIGSLIVGKLRKL